MTQPLEHDFTVSRDQWEANIFANASHFTVFRSRGAGVRETDTYTNLPAALADAGDDHKALVYAVTATDHATLLPRKEWPRLLDLWNAKQ